MQLPLAVFLRFINASAHVSEESVSAGMRTPPFNVSMFTDLTKPGALVRD